MFTENMQLKKAHQNAMIIAFSMMMTPIILGLVAELYLKNRVIVENIAFYPTLKLIIFALAIAFIVLIVMMQSSLLSDDSIISRFLSKKNEFYETPEQNKAARENQFIQRMTTAFTFTYALCEAIAIDGFILFIIGKDSSILWGFLGTSLFLMVVKFPKYAEWENNLREYLS